MNIKLALVLLIMTILGSLGGYFLKKASSNLNSIKTLFFNKYIYIGGMFYCAGASLNIILLKYIPYNIILPLNSLGYIWTLFLAHFLLKEKINKSKAMGIVLIILGVVFIAV